jgi:hypothetical protein
LVQTERVRPVPRLFRLWRPPRSDHRRALPPRSSGENPFSAEPRPNARASFFWSPLAALACAQGDCDGVYHTRKAGTRSASAGDLGPPRIDGTDLAIAPADRSVSILTSTLCGRYTRARLEILSRSLFVGLVDRRVREDGSVKLPAGDAYRILVEGRMNGTPIAAEAYPLREDRCLFDFVYLAAPDRFGSGVEAFRAMMRTLRLSGEGRK